MFLKYAGFLLIRGRKLNIKASSVKAAKVQCKNNRVIYIQIEAGCVTHHNIAKRCNI